jgi:hypothetical protein
MPRGVDEILTNKIDFNKTDEVPRDKLVRLKRCRVVHHLDLDKQA